MAKLVTDTNGRPPSKRVISESSSEEDTPIVKRSKSDSKPTQVLLPTPYSEPSQGAPTSSALSSADEDGPDEEDTEKDQDTKKEQDEALVEDSSDDDDDDTPIANSNYKPTLETKRSIDESSASTTLTTNTDPPSRQNGRKRVKVKKESQSAVDSSSDDDQPLVSRQPENGKPATGKSATAKPATAKPSATLSKRRTSTRKVEQSDSDDSSPSIQTKPTKPKPTKKPRGSRKATGKQQPARPETPQPRTNQGTTNQEQNEEAENDEYKWWEENKDDNSQKWTTLEHNGVLFPPDYTPLPSHVKMKYNGKSVDLPPESEEVAWFFGSMLNSDHIEKPTFVRNFFNDWREVLKQHPPRDGTKITDFSKCDFTPMFEYFQAERERKKGMTKAEKDAIRIARDELEEKYRTCILDGRVERVGNFRVEPPSLFRGRGDHPKTGKLKKRVMPEEIHINCSADSKVPDPPAGHRWAEVVHIPTASWLAYWKENINGHTKYVFLAAGSSLTGQSDFRKFEKARKLKDHIDRIREDYRAQLKDREMAVRQRATAMYLIDRFALRAGNEKSSEEEADTVGCCSLRLEHVLLEPPCTVTFDFLGKDSIRFFNKFEVDPDVFKNLMLFKKSKEPGDLMFDRLSTGSLNKHLSSYMEGLSAKVFRTYNASITFEQELEKNMRQLPAGASDTARVLAYTKANRQVAVLCNHQKSVSRNHAASMEKSEDKIRGHKYERRLARLELLIDGPKLDPETRASCLVEESDLDEEWMEDYEKSTQQKKLETLTKKFLKYDDPETASIAKANRKGDRLTPVEIYAAKSPKEQQAIKAKEFEEAEGITDEMKRKRERLMAGKRSKAGMSETVFLKLKKTLQAKTDAIHAAKALLKDRDEGKETSLGTSKTNYIDPRLTYAWCQKYGTKADRVFPKTLQTKFKWAAATPADWEF
ncbi:hypothetical protein PCANC_06109 [Puccinia coronata f. sp. avenae]|uniref:DNA topoisomerase I n=1 Tax=Puccinia coronata f. sp. avenae TaxID=200324 RepID=A0A2N5SWR3_9BASI|nr:hypothetical protein PCANC_10873 [Puccinia coronata f. sp. avenae]PLW53411.1 hypothetical protein PCANC_06109 [Puccinia coronata f. sp. avenae]